MDCTWDNIMTPLNVRVYEKLLMESQYPIEKTKFLVNGFTQGFDIGYRGPVDRIHESKNIPLRVGSHIEMWNKVTKEVKLHRFAGAFKKENLPFKHYVQSPIGLVPKAGNKTQLIFHLSFDFGVEEGDKSINFHTPNSLCTVRYNDLDAAIKSCLLLVK